MSTVTAQSSTPMSSVGSTHAGDDQGTYVPEVQVRCEEDLGRRRPRLHPGRRRLETDFEEQREGLLGVTIRFLAGEQAVTDELVPMIAASHALAASTGSPTSPPS